MSLSDIISQDEMDTLLSKVDANEVNQLYSGDPDNVEDFDFSSGQNKPQDEHHAIKLLNTALIEPLRDAFVELFNFKDLHIELKVSEMSRYSHYVDNGEENATYTILKADVDDFKMLIQLPSNLIFLAIEFLFGGDIRLSKNVQKKIAKVDVKVSEILTEQLGLAINKAWSNFKPIKWSTIRTVSNAILAKIAEGADIMVVNSFELCLHDYRIPFTLCTPSELFDASLNKRLAHVPNEAEIQAWHASMLNCLYDTNIDVSGSLAHRTMKLEEVMQFKVGDVINIFDPTQGFIYADDVQIFKAKFATQSGLHVAQLTELI